MSLDVYVGTMTRYYIGDWETLVEQEAREKGIPVEIMRPDDPEDAVSDCDEAREVILEWRDGLVEALAEHGSPKLDWSEDDANAYFTDKPAWEQYSDLILWAAYSEHPDLPVPRASVDAWTDDPAYVASSAADYDTEYPNLLRGAEIWLPEDLEFTFTAFDPAGLEIVFGSTVKLHRELDQLNEATWKATDEEIASWRGRGDADASLEAGAKFAFAIFHELSRLSVEHGLPMKLDY